MERLFLFVYQYRSFFTFLALQVVCIWLLVENNRYQGARFFNSANRVAASVNASTQNFRDFLSLRETNKALAEENAILRKKLEQRNQSLYSLNVREIDDPILINRFDFQAARIINNSVHRFKNHITLNKGTKDGIEPGMAVISSDGIVGKIKSTSEHFSVVTSLLNIDVLTSVQLLRTSHFGTVQWDALSPDYVNLLYMPRHVKPEVGDTVVTSGYNSVYPEGILVGTISKIELRDEALFHTIRVKLSQDFRKLTYVAVVKSNLKEEQEILEQTVEEQ